MTTLSIQSGSSKTSASFIANQLEWFASVIDTRLKLYFDQECAYNSIIDISNNKEEEQYFQLFNRAFSFEEKVFLWLSLSPVLKPQLLDYFYVKNQDIDNRFSEFGTYKPGQLNALLPTFDTLLFILAGDDLKARINYLNYFSYLITSFTQSLNCFSGFLNHLSYTVHSDYCLVNNFSAFNGYFSRTLCGL